jgi:hypothetical protein
MIKKKTIFKAALAMAGQALSLGQASQNGIIIQSNMKILPNV